MADAPKDAKVALAEMMYADEEMRAHMDKWTEEKFPGTQARLSTQRMLAEHRAEMAKEREKDRVEREQERARASRDRSLTQIKGDPNLRFRDDEIEPLEKFMLERGIASYEDAAYRYRQVNQVAAPASSSYPGAVEITGLDGGGGDDGKWLGGAFTKAGVNLGLADKLTKRRVQTILDDFKRDPIGANARWA